MTTSRTIYPQTKMLCDAMDVLLKQPEIKTEKDAFHALLQFTAFKLSYEVKIDAPWLKQEISEELHRVYDLNVLREDPWDWFGEVYQLRVSASPTFVSREFVETHTLNLQKVANNPDPYPLLDTFAGSGRLIIAMYNVGVDKNAFIYYAAEPDLTLYRMAILNFKLYGIPNRVVCLNSMEYDTRIHSPNWKYSNLWNPVEVKKLFTAEEVDRMEFTKNGDTPSVFYI